MIEGFTAWSWITGSVVFAIGGVAGFLIARQIKDKRTRQLELDLDDSRKALNSYRDDVNRHFLKTSILFNKLTDDYREIYEHLANGAERLCQQHPRTQKPRLPDRQILAGVSSAATEAEKKISNSETEEAAPHSEAESSSVKKPAASAAMAQNHLAENEPDNETERPQFSTSSQENEDQEEVHLGEESAPSIDLQHETNRSIH